MRPTTELRRWTGLAAACQAGPLRNGVRPDTAQPSWLFRPTRGKRGRGFFLPDAGGSPVKFGRPTAGAGELIAVAQAREEEEPNLGLCTEGSSPGWARSGGELGGKKSSGEGRSGARR
jgi:hypothetical protein